MITLNKLRLGHSRLLWYYSSFLSCIVCYFIYWMFRPDSCCFAIEIVSSYSNWPYLFKLFFFFSCLLILSLKPGVLYCYYDINFIVEQFWNDVSIYLPNFIFFAILHIFLNTLKSVFTNFVKWDLILQSIHVLGMFKKCKWYIFFILLFKCKNLVKWDCL
jgi:hypothetical protein